MTWAALFPGQGTQHPEMLPWLEHEPACAPALQALASMIGPDWRSRLHDTGWRSRNTVAQPLLTGVCSAAWAALSTTLGPPAVVAGYSVGELAAFVCAGVFDLETALGLATRRAALMDAAMGTEPAGMISVTGLPDSALHPIAHRFALEPAILIAPTHCLLAGTEAAIAAAWPALVTAGAEVKRLDIQTASHSSWMRPAAEAFAEVLDPLPFVRPRSLIVGNVTATASRDQLALKQALSAQLARPVRWQGSMQALSERQPGCVLEIGPGTSLAKLWRQAHPLIPARSLEDFQHWRAAVDWVAVNG